MAARAPYGLVAPPLGAFRDPSLAAFIDAHFDALSLHLNWFTAELFFHHGVAGGLEFLDMNASRRISLQKLLGALDASPRFASVIINNAGGNPYIEIQSKSGFVESLRRYIAARALDAGEPPGEVAHRCGASMRTIQRLQRAGLRRA